MMERLQKIIDKAKSDAEDLKITIDDLPTAVEIVSDPKNIPPLRAKLEQLRYLLMDQKLTDCGRELLKKFIDNCEREIAKAERRKSSSKMPGRLQINLLVIAVLWLGASIAPVYYFKREVASLDKSVFYFEDRQKENSTQNDRENGNQKKDPKKDDPSTVFVQVINQHQQGAAAPAAPATAVPKTVLHKDNSKTSDPKKISEKIYKTNWAAVLAFAVAMLVYLIFYTVLTVILFRTMKAILKHQRRQQIHDDLPALATILAIKIDPSDTSRLEARKNILKTLMREDSEE